METLITFQGIFFILWSISVYFVKKLINDIENRLKKSEENIEEIKENYINRFETITEKQNQSEKLLIEKLYQVELRIINEIAKLKNNRNANSD